MIENYINYLEYRQKVITFNLNYWNKEIDIIEQELYITKILLLCRTGK